MMNINSKQLILFIFATIVTLIFCTTSFRVYQVKEHSMEPILYNGQTIIILRGKNPNRGDVIVYENPEDKKLVVKRCILSPGDPVIISNGSLIAGKSRIPLTAKQEKGLFGIKFIPQNMFFATGDNIFNSHDSRDYGPVLINKLKGKVLLIK